MEINPLATALLDLDLRKFRELVDALQRDGTWKKVAEFVGIFDRYEISSLSASACPAESLLHELGTKLCTLEHLTLILQECALHDVLSVISAPEQMRIVRQPSSALRGKSKLSVQLGKPLELEFVVTGVPPPRFQWFKDDQPVAGQADCVLRCESFSLDMEGTYVCRASQDSTNDTSSPAHISSKAVKVEALPLACTVVEKPDEFICMPEDSSVLLRVKALGHPTPTFQWLHQNTILQNSNTNTLHIKEAKKHHNGEYRCFISNGVSDVTIKTNLIVNDRCAVNVYNTPVKNKVALLIANQNYRDLSNLTSTCNDVTTVAKTLQAKGFKTICLQNLNLNELKIAVNLLASVIKEQSFVFFYYAGHGFEIGDRYLLPVDSPSVNDFRKADALSETEILQKVLNKNPVLFVLLLDMCLKLPNKSENPAIYKEVQEPFVYKSNRNFIRNYSTTTHMGSYEEEGKSNGIYVDILKKYLEKDLPILTILRKTSDEIAFVCPAQIPSVFHNTVYDFYLNNPLQGFYKAEEELLSSLCVNNEEVYFKGATIHIRKFNDVFDNVVDVIVTDAELIEYEAEHDITMDELVYENIVVLRISELQRRKNADLWMRLKINGSYFDISQYFGISNLFSRSCK